jgi:hypothetical protein
MWNRQAAVTGVGILAVAIAGACADAPPTEPRAEQGDAAALFGSPAHPASFGGNIDAEFVRIARDVPGFGGFYYDEAGTLNVVMAAAQPLSRGEVQNRLVASLEAMGHDPAAARNAVVREGQYDFIQLDAMHQRVSSVLSLAGTVFTDADEVRNRVVIGVENDAAAANVERAVAMLGLPSGAVVIERAEAIHPMQTLQEMVRPVAGGLQINFTRGDPPAGFVCTLGFNVRSPGAPGVEGFVTNSHCSDTRGVVVPTPYWQHSRFVEGTFIGWEVHDPPFFQGGPCPADRNCRYSDALGARYVPGVDNLFGAIYRTTAPSQHSPGPLTIDPANPRWTITGEQAFPTVGQTAHKTGRTTGWLIGPVINTCQNTNVSGAGNITMLCQDRVEATPQGGDSGSPVYLRVGETNNVTLTGILWGGSANTYVFSAMQNIRFENPGPRPWITFPGQDPPPPPGGPR